MQKLSDFASMVAKDIDNYILEKIRGDPEELYKASLHIFKAGGKRLRPAILVATGLMLGGEYEDLIPYAAGVELVHNFTLIHDDIMDNDDYRRGAPTVHKIWGVPTAIIAGDLLFSKSFEVPSNHSLNKKQNHYNNLWALNVLAKAASIVAEGQMMDMSFENRWDVTEKEYMDMIYRKTSALIEASAMMGAIIAGASEKDVKRMGIYGRNIGIAFQIKDDILGIFGDEKLTGKPLYSDLREGKKTILVIRALEKADPETRDVLLNIIGKKGLPREEYEKVARIIEELGVKKEALREAERLIDEALQNLHDIEGNANKQYAGILEELAFYVIKREK